MGAAAGTQAGGSSTDEGIKFVTEARNLMLARPEMGYKEVVASLGPLPAGVVVNESAVERVRQLAASSESDGALWDAAMVAMNEKKSSGAASRMTQQLDAADMEGFKPQKANLKPRNSKTKEHFHEMGLIGDAAAAVQAAASRGASGDADNRSGESPETAYLISPEFKRAHSKKNVAYPPLAEGKARPFARNVVGSFSCHGQSDVGKYKENQDRGVVCFPFACRRSDERRALLIVADGHGEYGHTVSDYVVKHLVKVLATKRLDELTEASGDFGEIRDAFTETNAKLYDVPNMDSSTSGTTCVVAILKPTFIITANVGDSRCVLGQMVGPAPPASKVPTLYRAKDLTIDHKPDAPEEKARIERAGGFVTQPEWSASARVWLDKSCTWPGLAMARSIGDQCVKEVGVTADPDVIRYDFADNDAFLVLASDGIWEFLSSDDVVQIVSIHLHGKHRGKHNLAEICAMEVIKCAIKQWKIHEDGYRDDITCTVVILPANNALNSPGS